LDKLSIHYDRKEVYKKIFKGKPIFPINMFKKPGYRGLRLIPYPKHVKIMMNSLE
jgi:hypothetical protein